MAKPDVINADEMGHALGLSPTPIVNGFVATGDVARSASLIQAGAFEVVCKPIEYDSMELLTRESSDMVVKTDLRWASTAASEVRRSSTASRTSRRPPPRGALYRGCSR